MSSSWTAQQILALAPDPSSAKSGQELANARKWVTLGQSDTALWGECQGSGKNPYQTQIELAEPAYKCSCPSRKFPCKHALGLFILFAKSEVPAGTAPTWVEEWLAGRAKRTEQRAEKAETAAAPDPAAQAKRIAAREAKVTAGLADVKIWLADLIRQGLADVQSKPYKFWDEPAARLVDAQASGAARMLRNMAGIASTGPGWQDRLLLALGKLHLLIEGYANLDRLPPGVQADVRTALGWTQSQEDLLMMPGVADNWAVLGQRMEEEERLRVQRTWLRGAQSGRDALVLSFAHGSQPIDTSLIPGTSISAELVFFPSNAPQRAIVKTRDGAPMPLGALVGETDLPAATSAYCAALAANPWVERVPLLLADVVPVHKEDAWGMQDAAGRTVPVASRYEGGWRLMALSGGAPIALFSEWDGDTLLPLSVIVEGEFVGVA